MKRILSIFVLAILLCPVLGAQEMKLPRVSPKASVMQTIGLTDVTVTYSRPGVKGRPIWGALVPYDKVWRTGANEATTIVFSQDVKINGQSLPAGTYSLHTIPGKDEWTIIFNKEADQWGSYSYDETKDAMRIKVKPVEGAHQEWMAFSFPELSQTAGTLELAWEKIRVPLKLETNTVEQAMSNIKEALAQMNDWRVPYRAANFAVESNMLEDANRWIDQSLGLKETYWNLRVKANLLAKGGKTKEAIAAAEKAVKIGRENKDEPTEIEKTEKLIAEWKGSSATKK